MSKTNNLPWSKLQAEFEIGDASALWDALKDGKLNFPEGWEFAYTSRLHRELDVAIFRIKSIPTEADGEKVLQALKDCGAITTPAPEARSSGPTL